MAVDDILQTILDRVGDDAPYLTRDEVRQWPDGLLDQLLKLGLLTEAPRAEQVVCEGCERACIMPAQIVSSKGDRPSRALIACDKEEDIGLVTVELDRLMRWKITSAQLAATIAHLLGIDRANHSFSGTGALQIGRFKVGRRQTKLNLTVAETPALQVAGHELPVTDVLGFAGGCVVIDRNAITQLVKHPAKDNGEGPYKPSTIKREARKLKTQNRYDSWRSKARALRKRHPDKSERWIAGRITKLPIADGRSIERIRKIIRTK